MRNLRANVIRILRTGALALSVAGLAACASKPTAPQASGPAASAVPQARAGVAPRVDPTGPVTVALMVPLGSGDAERDALGEGLVNAARLAERDLMGADLDLRVYETGGDPAMARAAAERAVADGATVFVGPLFGAAAGAVKPVAERNGLNVLTFSTDPSVAGDNVFLLGQTAGTDADRILSYAAGQGITTVGMFYPDTPSGQVARGAVQSAAALNGMQMTNAMAYPRSFQGIQDASASYGGSHMARAVVLPDGGQGLATAASFLAFNGVGEPETQLLGLGQWNSAVTLREANLQGGLFVAPDPDLFNGFATRYEAAYGSRPSPIMALAYDGVAAVGALVEEARRSGDTDPFAVDRITDPGGFAGVNGIFRLRRDGMIDRALAVMEVGQDGFRVVDPAPRSFAVAAGS